MGKRLEVIGRLVIVGVWLVGGGFAFLTDAWSISYEHYDDL